MNETKLLLCNRVKYLRKIKKLTQAQLAEKLDLSINYVSQIERGIATPTFQTLEGLAKGLEVSLKTLFDFEATINKSSNSND